MLLDHSGIAPHIDASARVAPTAVVCGDVTIGANTSIGFGAVLTAESGPIVIGANCVIMDTAVIRGVRGNPIRIGDNVLVGPRAYLTGCEVADNVFLATGATIFNGARIGTRATVRINGIVHIKTVLAADTVVPHQLGCSGRSRAALFAARARENLGYSKGTRFPWLRLRRVGKAGSYHLARRTPALCQVLAAPQGRQGGVTLGRWRPFSFN